MYKLTKRQSKRVAIQFAIRCRAPGKGLLNTGVGLSRIKGRQKKTLFHISSSVKKKPLYMCVYMTGAWVCNSSALYCIVVWHQDHITGHLQSSRESERVRAIIRKRENHRVSIFQARCTQCAGAMATAELLHSTSQTIPAIHAIRLSDHINLKTVIH